MAYKHQHFSLDASGKKVFDENGRELRLTGNAYRLLVFLCEKRNATLTEISDYLDWAKDYDENHIRQYRYKINNILGHDVIEYKNGVYSLIGEVKEVENIELGERNTDLLQADNVKSGKNIMDRIKEIKFTVIPAVIASIFLLLSFFDWPYGYYSLLRIVVTGAAVYYAYYLYKTVKKLNFWFWSLVVITILFNPVFPIYLKDKMVWGVIDVITAAIFIGLIVRLRKHKQVQSTSSH